jgi:hypothetical protein
VDASAANQSAATKEAIADATKGLATEGSLENARNDLAKEIQAAKDIGLQGDAALQAGLDSMAAKMGVNQADVLKQLETSTDALRKEFGTGLADVTAAQKTQYDALTAAQKAEADARIAQGQTLQDAITAAQTATTGQISDLGAKTDAQYNALTAAQKAEADARVAQGQSLQDAITGVAGQVTGLEGQLTQQGKDFAAQLMQQGMDYTTAMQTAIGAQSALFGTQIGDVQAEIAANEARRIADQQAAAAAAEAQRQADKRAAATQARQANIRTTATRAQTSAQGIMQQLEAMQRAGMAPQQPAQLVEAGPGFDLSDPLNTGFFSGFQAKKAQQNQQPTTKIAAGGYIDDLLAGDLSVDELLDLLR